MPTLLHRLLTAAVVLGVSTSLGACSEDPVRPAPLDTPSSTPTSTTTSTSPGPTDPTSSATPQAETAEQFIRRWVRTDTAMQNSGRTDAFDSLTSTCQSCEDLSALVEEIYESGGSVKTRGWQILDIERDRLTSDERPTYVVKVRERPTELLREEGGEVEKLPGGRQRYDFDLIKIDDEWVVDEYYRFEA